MMTFLGAVSGDTGLGLPITPLGRNEGLLIDGL
jgi:hypothetical protein